MTTSSDAPHPHHHVTHHDHDEVDVGVDTPSIGDTKPASDQVEPDHSEGSLREPDVEDLLFSSEPRPADTGPSPDELIPNDPEDEPKSEDDEVKSGDEPLPFPDGIVADSDAVVDTDLPDKLKVEASEPPLDESPHVNVEPDNSDPVDVTASPWGKVVEDVVPQYIPGTSPVREGPAVDFTDAVAYANPPSVDAVKREHEDKADSPHGDLAQKQDYPIQNGAPVDSHIDNYETDPQRVAFSQSAPNAPAIGDNDAVRIREKNLDEMAEAAGRRADPNQSDVGEAAFEDANPAAEQPFAATAENVKVQDLESSKDC